jgi:hypothetical protein
LRGQIDEKAPWEVIKKKFPTIGVEDFKKFLENEDRAKMKDLRKWGREMRDKNLGNHHLGSRGYEGVKKRWNKEDQELAAAGKTNPYDKYHDPKAQQYIRSRYYFDAKGNLVTSKKVQDLEKTLLVRIYRKSLTLISIIFSRYSTSTSKWFTCLSQKEQAAASHTSSSSSTPALPWDKPFERAMNLVQDRPVTKRPHRGRVVGAGVGHKHSHYYPETEKDREDRKKKEKDDMSKRLDVVADKVENIPDIVKQQVAEQFKQMVQIQHQALINWDLNGRKGPMPLFSMEDSNSVNRAGPNAPATEAPAADARAMEAPSQPEQSPALSQPRSSPSVCGAPAKGPTPLAELNALTVTSLPPRFAQHTCLLHPCPLSYMSSLLFAGQRGKMHLPHEGGQ